MLTKCPTSLKFLSSMTKQHAHSIQCLRPALYLCTGELSVRFAGHSKWQNIRHTKAAKDLAKGQLYCRIIRDLEKATKTGSFDPKLNSELQKIITYAQSVNMPAATINKALSRFEAKKKNPVVSTFGFRGPNGILLLVTASCTDMKQTRFELRKIANKYQYTFQQGDPLSAFYGKGWIFAKPPSDITDVTDKSLEDAIEVGAEEVEPDEENPERLKFICEMSETQKVKTKLESRNYVIEEAVEMYLPRAPIELPENEMEAVNTVLEEFEENADVEKVFVNII